MENIQQAIEKNELLKRLLEAMGDGVFLVDPTGKIKVLGRPWTGSAYWASSVSQDGTRQKLPGRPVSAGQLYGNT